MYKVNYIDEKRHGLYEDYYSNGTPWYKENYINGELHGLYERYSNSGKSYIKQYIL
jgi:antitoxin component YwqK of YwqJK toxin-antitoxin module